MILYRSINGIPRLVICTLLLMVLKPGFCTIVLTLVITEWIGMSRIARAEMLKLKEQEFILASRTGSRHSGRDSGFVPGGRPWPL